MMEERVKQQARMVKQLKNEKNELVGRLQVAVAKGKEIEEDRRLTSLKISEQNDHHQSYQENIAEYKQMIDELKRKLSLEENKSSKDMQNLESRLKNEIQQLENELEEKTQSVRKNEQ